MLVAAGGGPAFSGSTAPVIGTATQGREASPTCANSVMQSIEYRAWMEGEREIVQNANIIGKSDSVLEYSCFKSWLDNTARDQGFFSDAAGVGPVSRSFGMGTASMDRALQRTVGATWAAYRNANFSHSYLGGRLASGPAPITPVAGAPYSCDVMNQVWELARCQNFQPAGLTQDGFFTLQEYVSGSEKRALPRACNKDGRWTYAFDAVNSRAPWMNADWLAQRSPQFLDRLGVTSGACAGPVQTGLTLKLVGGTTIPDAVCPTPGCWYNGSTCNN